MFFYKKGNKNKGFSMMEIIISVGIVSFAFVGVMAVFASNIRVEILNRDRITAVYLAQEAVEVVRQKRDANWFASANWDAGINSSTQALSAKNPNNLAEGWDLVAAGALESEQYKQKIFLVNDAYIQSSDYNDATRPGSWTSTRFKRIINIEKPSAYQIKMTVTVYYGSNNSNVQVVSYLYNNWYTN